MRRILRAVKGVWHLWRRRNTGYFVYLVTECGVPWLMYWLLNEVPRRGLHIAARASLALVLLTVFALLGVLLNWLAAIALLFALGIVFATIRLAIRSVALRTAILQARSLWSSQRDGLRRAKFTRWADLTVDAATRAKVDAARMESPEADLVLGRIDSDGRVLWLFGQILPLPCVSAAEFNERSRFEVDIVLCGDEVLVRKDYRGDRASFVREWLNLVLLSGKANVASPHHVDESRPRLYRNLVFGKTVQGVLVEAGAKILQAQTKDDPEFQGLSHHASIEAVWKRGRALIPTCLRGDFLQELERQLDLIHEAGVVGVSVTYGNVIVEGQTQVPWFIDLEKARAYPTRRGWLYAYWRDQDRIKFNQCYGRNLITEKSARVALAEQSAKLNGWYAPIDFGNGLVTRGFWSTNSGMGRWHHFNGPILDRLVRGRRVLDLGSNNGLMPLMMLRAGACEVLGLELSADYVACARLVHQLFEWRDMRRYNFDIRQGNMLEILNADWGQFEVITAFCTLYYLTPDEMAAVVRRAAQLAPLLVVQAKTDTRMEAADNKATKSSLPFLKGLMEQNGFPNVEVHAARGFTRPLLIGRRA